jgi:hypothetical protein
LDALIRTAQSVSQERADVRYQGEESTCMKYKLSMSEISSTLIQKAWDDIKIIMGILGFLLVLQQLSKGQKQTTKTSSFRFIILMIFLQTFLG